MRSPSMQGTVTDIDPSRGIVAIRTELYKYTIVELLTYVRIDVGDTVRWAKQTRLGDATYVNVTRGTTLPVFVQNHWVHPDQLRKHYFLA